MAEKFLDGELALDAFIDVYQSQRKLAHVRRVKIEKLQEMVLKRPRPPQAPAPLLPLPRAPEPAPAAPLPYPVPEAGGAPSVLPRRIPPPVPAGRLATPFTAAMGLAQAPPAPRTAVPARAPPRGPPRPARVLHAVCVAVPTAAPPETPPSAASPARLHPAVRGESGPGTPTLPASLPPARGPGRTRAAAGQRCGAAVRAPAPPPPGPASAWPRPRAGLRPPRGF